MERLLKFDQFDRCRAVWKFLHVTPAPKSRPSLLKTVASQLAWWPASGPQAGEKRRVETPTPDTAVQLGPKHPP